MDIEDYFTLTEMKDGLLTPARVEDLVSMMKNEKLSVSKNMNEAAKQWSTVASTLAATENKNSLDQFIRLDGLYLLDKWLRQASDSTEISDGSVEESIWLMLEALMKLPVSRVTSDTSGIRTTINDLLRHKSSRVQEIARTLFDSWNRGGNKNDADRQDVVEEKHDYLKVKSTDSTLIADSACQGHCPVKPKAEEDNCHAQILSSCNADASHTTLISKNEDVSTPPQKTVSSVKESSEGTEGAMCITIGLPLDPMESNVKGMSKEVSEVKILINDSKETDAMVCCPKKTSEKKMHSASSTSVPEPHFFSGDPPASALQSSIHSADLCHVDAMERQISPIKSTSTGVEKGSCTSALESKSEVVNCGPKKHLNRKVETKSKTQVSGYNSTALTGCILRKQENRETSFSGKEGTETVSNGKELAGRSILKGEKDKIATARNISNSIASKKLSDIVDKSRLDMELDFMVDDALEVATQVAKEVERQVVDYRESFAYSSSEENSVGGRLMQPPTPDSINGELQSSMEQSSEMPTGQKLPGCPNGEEDHSKSSENSDGSRQSVHNHELSSVTAAVLDPESNTEKSMCDFDLNEEVSSEKVNHQRTSDCPLVKIASPSKAATSELVAEPPLRFEDHGSKRSAGTSEKTSSAECSSSLKQRQDFRGIDLNVTEGDNIDNINLVAEKQIRDPSGLCSGKSSIEVSSRRADRIKLDLNLIFTNDNMSSSDWRTEGRFHYQHMGSRNSPLPSVSSSLMQASMKNIDLNEVDLGASSSQVFNAHGGFQLENNPVISIMGTRVVVNRNDYPPRTLSFLPNEQVSTCSTMDVNVTESGDAVGAQPAITSAPFSSSMFRYNDLTMGCPASLSSTTYGAPASVPYTVTSRGALTAPDIMGSMTAGPSSYSQRFHMSMTSSSSSLDGFGPYTRPVIDLNCGLTLAAPGADGNSREPSGGLRPQLFIPRQGSIMEQQQMRLNMGLGVKRSEPESGWDLMPSNFMRSPWR